jgi:hypothetical protein
MEKCDVLCANCHRKHHDKERSAHPQQEGSFLACVTCETTWLPATGPRCWTCGQPGVRGLAA